MLVPPKRKVNIKLLAKQAYETLAMIAAVLPQNQNAFGAAKNCWHTTSYFCSSNTPIGQFPLAGKSAWDGIILVGRPVGGTKPLPA